MLSSLELCRKLGIDAKFAEALEFDFEDSQRSFNGELPFFMQKEYYERQLAKIKPAKMDGILEGLARVAAKTAHSHELRLLAWHLHYATFLAPRSWRTGSWPELREIYGDDCGLFYLFGAISAIDLLEKKFAELGLPEKYARDTVTWIGGSIQTYRNAHRNHPGHDKRQLPWVRLYVEGLLFRIGRFEYLIENKLLPEVVKVYRHKQSREVVAFCRSSWQLDGDGMRLFWGDGEDKVKFTAELKQEGALVTGTAVNPAGFAEVGRERTISLDEYEEVFHDNDFVVSFHIPPGGGMTLDLIRESFKEATEFFSKYFKQDLKGFFCSSWIFNPAWHKLIPESNLGKFQFELYLFPLMSGGTDGLFFIFGRDDTNYADYPRDNSMRRCMLDILDRGEKLRNGGCFFLTEDLDKFGTQCYRNNYVFRGTKK
ncbi:MAG: acyltransferase domain-containing protein [Lentisphaeria bacterium]|nr:acyltransferase domain-containing protein [Lentisphaeria bacterium]